MGALPPRGRRNSKRNHSEAQGNQAMTVKKALTIAGSDCSGGAGIQADLKTFQERDVYGMSVLTVMVAMRPENWTHVVFPVAEDVIEQQFRTILPGIGCDALKTGMLPTAPIIDRVGRLLKEADARRVVIDPVMVCKGGGHIAIKMIDDLILPPCPAGRKLSTACSSIRVR